MSGVLSQSDACVVLAVDQSSKALATAHGASSCGSRVGGQLGQTLRIFVELDDEADLLADAEASFQRLPDATDGKDGGGG